MLYWIYREELQNESWGNGWSCTVCRALNVFIPRCPHVTLKWDPYTLVK